jgi:membrane protease YdiL (CAAX protease family)
VAARVLFRPDHPHPAFELFHSGDLWSVLLVGLTAVILAPVLEELLFRGLLLSGLSPFVGPWTAILLTGALFGLAHTSVWPDPIPLTVLGIALGLAMCRTGSLWTPIFFHGFFNGSMLLLSLIVK